MVLVEMRGGMGNQMFIYATAFAHAQRTGQDLVIDTWRYDTSYLLRDFTLDQFEADTSRRVMKKSFGKGRNQIRLYNVLHKTLLRMKYKVVPVEEEEEFHVQKLPESGSRNQYLSGYWQCHEYFDDVRKDLLSLFTLKDRGFFESSRDLNSFFRQKVIAVHIRRTDYKTMKGGWCIPASYYERALKMMQEKTGGDCPVLVFSDDIEYCRELFKGRDNIHYVPELGSFSDTQEFYLMTKCTHFVIANSSFSWWAAYLADRPEKIVIAPVAGQWKRSFYPDQWTTVCTELEN